MNSFDLLALLHYVGKLLKRYEFVLIFLSSLTLYHILSNVKRERNEEKFDVIVIGAGFSGIGAAKSLFDNGIKNIAVLEAKNYIGGRVKKVDFAGVQVPLGAGWIHKIEGDSLLWRLARENGMSYYIDDYDDLTYREAGRSSQLMLESWNEASQRLDGMLQSGVEEVMRTQMNDIGLDEGLRLCGWHANSKLEKAVEYLKIDFENGNPANKLSSRDFPYTGEGQDVVITDQRGFEDLARVLSIPFSDKVYLNHDVVSVRKNNGEYTIETSHGQIFKSSYVMVSVSNTVLQSHRMTFQPPLSREKMEALDNILTGDYCKIFFHFPVKFWENSNYIIIGQENKKFVHWQNLNRVFPGHNILLTTLTGSECKQSQLQTDNHVMNAAYQVLSEVYGDIPFPNDMIRSNWSFDPHVQGAYSNPTIGTTSQHYTTIRETEHGGTLWFTGEHVGDKSGYVHGALEHGLESGKLLAQSMRRRN